MSGSKMEQILLHKFFAGETNPKEDLALKQWIEESEANRKILLNERKIYDALHLSEELVLNAQKNFWWHTPYIRSLLVKTTRVASVVLITLVMGAFLYLWNSQSAVQTIEVPVGHRSNVTLPDGSNVWLNGNTSISYPLSFGIRNRTVRINGEAYFDVIKNRKPFRVISSKGIVEVLGTQFNVCDYADYDAFEVALIEGSVSVRLANNSSSTTLASGYYLALKDGKLSDPMRIEYYDSFSWKDGLISFRNESFENIMRSFERNFGIRIVINDLMHKDRLYTGKFRQEDGINYALRVLQQDLDFEFRRSPDQKSIIIE